MAGAGIAGLAVGFGAQTFVKDVIGGLFLLIDDVVHVGDLIRIGDQTGTVEAISLRLLKVRKFDGELLIVPAGELRTFGNKSEGFARAIVEVGVSYEQDVDEVMAALKQVAKEWYNAKEDKSQFLEEPSVMALTGLGDSAVSARIVLQVLPGAQFLAEREAAPAHQAPVRPDGHRDSLPAPHDLPAQRDRSCPPAYPARPPRPARTRGRSRGTLSLYRFTRGEEATRRLPSLISKQEPLRTVRVERTHFSHPIPSIMALSLPSRTSTSTKSKTCTALPPS